MHGFTHLFYIGLVLIIFYNILMYLTNRKIHELILFIIGFLGLILWGVKLLDLSPSDMGLLSPVKGIITGTILSIFTLLVVFTLSKISLTKDYFNDTRTKNVSKNTLLYKVFFQIPVATVLLEELLFRGIIYGYFELQYSSLYAIIVSSVFFGLWHILPAITFSKTNKNSSSLTTTIITTVLFTAASGIAFALLRYFTGSIYASVIFHYTVNSSSLVASWYNGKNK